MAALRALHGGLPSGLRLRSASSPPNRVMDKAEEEGLVFLDQAESLAAAMADFGAQFARDRHETLDHSQNKQVVTFGAPGSGKSRLLTELCNLLHCLTPERVARSSSFEGLDPEFVAALLGCEVVPITYNHLTKNGGAGEADSTASGSLNARILIGYYFEISFAADFANAARLIGEKNLRAVQTPGVVEAILRDARQTRPECRSLVLLVDEVRMAEDTDSSSSRQNCGKVQEICHAIGELQEAPKRNAEALPGLLGAHVFTVITMLDMYVTNLTFQESGVVGSTVSKRPVDMLALSPLRFTGLLGSVRALYPLAWQKVVEHADVRFALVACLGHPRTSLAVIRVAQCEAGTTTFWPLLRAAASDLFGLNEPVNALSKGLTGSQALACGVYQNTFEAKLWSHGRRSFIPKMTPIRILMAVSDKTYQSALLTSVAAKAEKEARIKETEQWLTKMEPWREWQREVALARSDPVHSHVSKWLHYALDPLKMDEAWDYGTPFENLVLGRLALHSTMSLLHTSVDRGSIETLRGRCMKTTLLDLLGGENVLCNERTRKWLRTVVVKLHGYSALVVFPRSFRFFCVDPSSPTGGLSRNGCNVAWKSTNRLSTGHQLPDSVVVISGEKGVLKRWLGPSLNLPKFIEKNTALKERTSRQSIDVHMQEIEAADVVVLEDRTKIIEFIVRKLHQIKLEGVDDEVHISTPEGCDNKAIDSASDALDKYLTACYPQLRRKTTPRDGNSQFSAIAQALQRKGLDSRATAASVRAAVVSWLLQNEAVAMQGATAADFGIASSD
eukprot:m51a1_g12658 hypothetical protein (788) ;mRNA; r:644-3726